MIINQKGYTYIELLIVIVTMAILFTVGYGNFRGFQRREKIEVVAEQFRADMRDLQQRALSGVKPEECTGELSHYKLDRFNSSRWVEYHLSAVCPNAVNIKGTLNVGGTRQLPKGVRHVILPSGSSPIEFYSVSGGTDIDPGQDVTIEIGDVSGLSNSNKKKPNTWKYKVTVTVTSAGEIN